MRSNEELMVRRRAAIARGVGAATPVFVDRADNAEVWDVEGRRYVDFASGIAVLGVGHRHPKVIAAVERQLARFTHMPFQVMGYEPYVALAERLNRLAPFSGDAKTVFFTTGAEATENAIKIAKNATGRQGVVALAGGFHGRTAMASALNGKVSPYKIGLGLPLPGVFHIPFPADSAAASVEAAFSALDLLFTADIGPEQIAAIIVEPVQGEGGFNVVSFEFLRRLRALCDRFGILLVVDEVQTGFGRTGRMFAIEHSGVEPDLVAVAKSLAGGFPLSGVIGRAQLMDSIAVGGLGGTYAGSPIGCAAALASLDVVETENLVMRAGAIGRRIRNRLEPWPLRDDLHPIANVRGLGAMIGFDVMRARGEPVVDGAAARRVVAHAVEAGLIVLTCGHENETIRILTPLTAPDAIIDEGLDHLESALKAAA